MHRGKAIIYYFAVHPQVPIVASVFVVTAAASVTGLVRHVVVPNLLMAVLKMG